MIQEKISGDNSLALKNGDKEKRAALSFLLAALQAKAKEMKVALVPDQEAISLLQKQRKQREETIEKSVGRDQAITQARYEITLIESYLPLEPSEEEIVSVVDEVIRVTDAISLKDMGKVMKEVRLRLIGVDSAKLSSVIKKALSNPT